jgi:SecD/SecF fusion protein
MSTSGVWKLGIWLTSAAALAVLLAMPVGTALAQDAPDAAAAAAESEQLTDGDVVVAAEENETADAAPAAGESGGTAEESAEDSTAAAPTSPETATAASDAGGLAPWMMGLIVVSLFVLPVMIGNFLAKQLRMPDYGWKFSLLIGAVAIAGVVVSLGEFKFGPDLAGGITLIYELADTSVVATEEDDQNGSTEEGDDSRPRKVDMPQLISALKERIDPTSTREVTIREQGASAIEIIIPATGPDALEYVKRRITDLGQLEFRITADTTQSSDRNAIEQATNRELVPLSQKDVMLGGRKVAEWVRYAEAEFGPADEEDDRHVVKRLAGDTPEILVLMDPWDVTGEYLTSASKGVGDHGEPAVHFSFSNQGARRFQQLTSENRPNQATGAERYLGIILDKRLISAPRIITTISSQGQISGSAMNEQEVDYIVSILNAGSLPAALDKTPISEEIVSPTLGEVTIEKGKFAISVSFVAVVLFMVLYYRLSGLVSVFALFLNLLLLLAAMVLIKAAFTLPGLAGLVLVIGMAVDANVLIFERIREELRNGAALRMAIRNGYSRATTTIIDANLTTMLAGIIMYAVGRDQIKGFAVTLILGIMMSMFTAIFCSRIVLDVLERRGWIKSLKMNSFIGQTNINFMAGKTVAVALSLVLISVGLFAVYQRGMSMLNIDFTGGSSVSFVLKSDSPQTIAEVRDALVKTDLEGKNLLIVRSGETDTRYTINTSEQSVEQVKQTIVDTLKDKLLDYSLEIRDLKPFTEGDFNGAEATVVFNEGSEYSEGDGVSHDALLESIQNVIAESGATGVLPSATNPLYRTGSSARYKEWTLRLSGADVDTARSLLERFEADMDATPMFPLASKIGGRVSAALQVQALYAIGLSCIGIIGYIWLRFQKISFGLAAVVALVHDVLATIGIIAFSAYVVNGMPSLANALMIDSFQISLDIVAALLTIIGYSVNDTIIVFDRIREVRGKSPNLTVDMINTGINQTLSRTILTSGTTFLVVAVLYALGGDGIHDFAFALVVGIFVGTYSSIYIAAPTLYWLSGTESKATAR